jgi:type VI secretion system secreted protein VgrG
MPAFAQQTRLLSVDCPALGKDVLLLTAFSGREELSHLFRYQLDLVSENDALAAGDIVGKPITWAVNHVDKEPRYFNGVVSSFSAGGKAAGGLRSYRAEVVPWLWLLTRTANCKIFQNKSADKIIQEAFDDLGFTDYKISLRRTPVARDYCVQYRETTFSFVTRLMEEEGIFYFFKHENGKHTLVLADANSAYFDCPEKEVEFVGGSLSTNHISAWEHRYEYRPGKLTQTDYNFETPSTSLLTTTSSVVDLPRIASFEIFEYPGLYAKTGDGTPLTRIRMQEQETQHDVVTGSSTCCTFTPGGRFELTRHECEGEMKAYVLTGVQHHGTDPSSQVNGKVAEYGNTFTCIPATVVFRPARVTPKPVVQGAQTAVVVGPAGEEIFTDKYSRIKVQFHWDRVGKKDENSSCWVRVSTTWAGKGWGFLQIPRIGHEVIVDFLEGDPDRPIVIGCVYNAENMPAGTLPADRATSGMKSATYPGNRGYNQVFITDTKQKEMITIHAQKDMTTTVEHDETLTVHNNRKSTIDVDDTESVGSNQKVTIGADQTLEVGANQKISIGSNQTVTVGAGRTVSVSAADKLTTGGDRTVSVGAGRAVGVAGADKLTVGGAQSIDVAGAIKITSGASITLEVGGSSIVIAPGAITITSGGPITMQGATINHNC